MRSFGRPGNRRSYGEFPDGRPASSGGGGGEMLKKFPCIVLMLPAFADQLQNRPAVLQLTLKQAVAIALAPEGSTRVQLAEEALKQAETREAQSRAALLPDFEGYLTEQNQTTNLKAIGIQFPSIPGFNIPSIAGPYDVFDVRAQLNQTVFDFSTIRRYQASKVSVQAAQAD